MKKNLVFLLIVFFIVGCGRVAKDNEVLVKINDYEISKSEFNELFKESSFSTVDSPESRKEFLNNLIDRILILQDAQKKGLDKDEKFLKMIEKFWEQSLLRLALERKSKDIAGSSFVSDKTIQDAYQRMLKEGKTDKSYDQMYQQIKWDITKLKESQMIAEWLIQLRKNSDIKISKDLDLENRLGGANGK